MDETGYHDNALDVRVLHRANRARPEGAPLDMHETTEIVILERELVAEFGPLLGPETVMRCIADAVTCFADARVRTYLTVLIRREATERLRAWARQAEGFTGPATSST
jgi:protein-tyrosine phosphatase-like protein